MDRFALFTDVSVNPHTRQGVGGYLLLPVSFLDNDPRDINRDDIAKQLMIKGFSDTSSTRLEVQTVLWAVTDLQKKLSDTALKNLMIYTDSQCVVGLLKRREQLVLNDFIAKSSAKLLTNAILYREFYAAHDRFSFQLFKVSGHSRTGSQTTIQRIFSYVDREVRSVLKKAGPCSVPAFR